MTPSQHARKRPSRRVAERLPTQRVQLGAVIPDRDAQAQGDAGGGRGGVRLDEEIADRGRGEQAAGQELAVFAGVGPCGGRRQPFEGETDLGCAASVRPALGIAAGHVQHRLHAVGPAPPGAAEADFEIDEVSHRRFSLVAPASSRSMPRILRGQLLAQRMPNLRTELGRRAEVCDGRGQVTPGCGAPRPQEFGLERRLNPRRAEQHVGERAAIRVGIPPQPGQPLHIQRHVAISVFRHTVTARPLEAGQGGVTARGGGTIEADFEFDGVSHEVT